MSLTLMSRWTVPQSSYITDSYLLVMIRTSFSALRGERGETQAPLLSLCLCLEAML